MMNAMVPSGSLWFAEAILSSRSPAPTNSNEKQMCGIPLNTVLF